MISQMCPACSEIVVSPMGVSQDLLIVLEKPSERDEEMGLPFSIHSKYITPGEVLRKEFSRAGLNVSEFRCVTYVLHNTGLTDNCIEAGRKNVLDEAKDKKAILLVGQEAVKAFMGEEYDAADVNGLQVESPFLSAPIIYALINPTQIFSGGIGELRFGIQEFAARLKAEGLV